MSESDKVEMLVNVLKSIVDIVDLTPNSDCCAGDCVREQLDAALLDIEERAKLAIMDAEENE